METWTPLQVFIVLLIGTFIAGFGGHARANRNATLRELLASGLYWSAVSTSFCMAGYEWIGGKEKPWRVLGIGGLIALGIINMKTLKKRATTMLATMLGAPTDGKGDGAA
jgi:hypothetical protein